MDNWVKHTVHFKFHFSLDQNTWKDRLVTFQLLNSQHINIFHPPPPLIWWTLWMFPGCECFPCASSATGRWGPWITAGCHEFQQHHRKGSSQRGPIPACTGGADGQNLNCHFSTRSVYYRILLLYLKTFTVAQSSDKRLTCEVCSDCRKRFCCDAGNRISLWLKRWKDDL